MHWFPDCAEALKRHCESWGQYPEPSSSGVNFFFAFLHSPAMHLNVVVPIGPEFGLLLWSSMHAVPFQHFVAWQHAALSSVLGTGIGAKLMFVAVASLGAENFSMN